MFYRLRFLIVLLLIQFIVGCEVDQGRHQLSGSTMGTTWNLSYYASSGDRWLVVDSFRGGATNNDDFLDFQDTLSERDMNATNGLTFNANSFTINTTDGALNNSAGSYIYWAIA